MSDPAPSSSSAHRIGLLVWGVACYALFFACFLYAIAFIGDFSLVPKTIDSGEPGPLGTALAVNLALLSLFAVQHSVMARPAFKRAWTKIVPEAAERPTYVLASTLALALLFACWQPIAGTVWTVTSPIAAGVLRGLYFSGWILLLYATALIDHFDLFGLRQAWLGFRGRAYTNHPFATPGMYAHVPPSPVRVVGDHLLVDARDERRPPPVRRGRDGVHGRGGVLRGTRPRHALRRRLSPLPGERAEVPAAHPAQAGGRAWLTPPDAESGARANRPGTRGSSGSLRALTGSCASGQWLSPRAARTCARDQRGRDFARLEGTDCVVAAVQDQRGNADLARARRARPT
jgi:protein-S-isoprenylcysteine O-methyltransferase Ste14